MEDFEKVWSMMLAGEVYDATHPGLTGRLVEVRERIHQFNNLPPADLEAQRAILRELLGSCGERFHVNQPFRCDYGCNIHIGENFFANFNLTILDEAEVRMGDNVFIGPNVSIYTACHPLDAESRNSGVEWAEPVAIGNSVWIGGGVTIVPGVTIGNRVVIGAGSVVTRDVPDDCVVAGNPARPLRKNYGADKGEVVAKVD